MTAAANTSTVLSQAHFLCPITHETMDRPIVNNYGDTYSFRGLYLREKQGEDSSSTPVTHRSNIFTIDNYSLKAVHEEWKKRNELFGTARVDEDAYEGFRCSYTNRVMSNAFVDRTGISVDYSVVELYRWEGFVPNKALQACIDDWNRIKAQLESIKQKDDSQNQNSFQPIQADSSSKGQPTINGCAYSAYWHSNGIQHTPQAVTQR